MIEKNESTPLKKKLERMKVVIKSTPSLCKHCESILKSRPRYLIFSFIMLQKKEMTVMILSHNYRKVVTIIITKSARSLIFEFPAK